MNLNAYIVVASFTAFILAFTSVPAAEIQPRYRVAPTDRPQSSVGVDVLAHALRLRGDLTARSENGRTYVAPQLFSTVQIAPKVNFETRVDFAEWNTQSTLIDNNVEVKVRLRSVLPLIKEIEGRSWRASDGATRNTLLMTVAEKIASTPYGRPITFRGSATVEQAVNQGVPMVRSTGMEASLTGFGGAGTENRLAFVHRIHSGATDRQHSSISFARSWPVNKYVRVAINCELIDSPEGRQDRVAMSWQGKF